MLSDFCQRFVNVLSTFYFFEHSISLRILSFTTDNSLCSNKKTLPYSERALEVPIGFEPMKNGFADRPLRPLGHSTMSLDYAKLTQLHPVSQ